jgi:SAM-dependent methyltransferase
VSKAHDESSRRSVPVENEETPVPVAVPTDEASQTGKRKDGLRRSRPGIPRERSGPIGIASGDFATPSVRKRTITQPRGTPALGVPMLQPPPAIVVGAPAPATPAPAVATPAPATPAPAASAPAPVTDRPAPVAGTIGGTPTPSPLTPGPLTPIPVAAAPTPPPVVEPETPGPEPVAVPEPDPVALASAPATPPPFRSDVLGATPVDLVDGPSGQGSLPPPIPTDNPFGGAAPTGDLDTEAAVLAAEAAAVRALDSGPLTPPPDLMVPGATPPPFATDEETPTPPPAAVEATAPQATDAAAVETPESPETETKTAAAADELPDLLVPGAVPESPMASEGSAASAEIANPIVETPTPVPAEAVPEIEEDDAADALEVEEASEAETSEDELAKSAAARVATPPPIPVHQIKTPTPGAEVRPPAPPPVEAPAPLVTSLPTLPIMPEALSQRPRRPKRSKPWFEEVFDEDYLRTLPFLRPDQTVREVDFIAGSLECPPGSELLDVGCGYGRHAVELVDRGFNVTGLDLSFPLLIRAAEEAEHRGVSVKFVHADMREMSFENQFDGAYCMLTTFGYFDEETNLRVAERIARALKPGSRLLLDIVNRDYVVGDLPLRVWWEGTGCVVLEEVDFNFHTSRINTHRSIVFEDGRQLEQELSIRAYSLHEIGRLLRQAGFRVLDVSGHLTTRGQFFGGSSRNLLVVAEKPKDDQT